MSLNRAIQRELDSFYQKLTSNEFTIRQATKGAFTQARAKLNPWAFERLNEVAVNTFYECSEYYVWNGHRTLSVDGTRFVLPNHPSILEEFGTHSFGSYADSPRSLAIASMLYDVLNQVTIDAKIEGYSSSERALLKQHYSKLETGDLLLLDRGYPSLSIMFTLKAKGVDFCMRMKDDWWKEVRKFSESKQTEQWVEFSLPAKDKADLNDYPEWKNKKLACRLIRIELENGDYEILCTSLTDQEKYLFEEFKELYHLRWNEEEAYKLLKSRINIEDFSGKTARAVKQDFYAKVFLLTLTATYAHPIEKRVREEYKADQTRKYDQKINRTNAISMTREILVGVFLKNKIKAALMAFDDLVKRTREIIRPNRNVKRKKKPNKSYSINYKRL